MFIINSTYKIKININFIFISISIDIQEWKNERIKEENSKPENSSFIPDNPLTLGLRVERSAVQLHFSFIYFYFLFGVGRFSK
jgi:hypothetical protein